MPFRWLVVGRFKSEFDDFEVGKGMMYVIGDMYSSPPELLDPNPHLLIVPVISPFVSPPWIAILLETSSLPSR